MMHHLIACARRRQSAELMLKVKRDNTAAIALYRKLGFDLTPLDADNLRGKLRLKAIS
jgi:ribosomal protein S18 acetylase RimI-like enzyme